MRTKAMKKFTLLAYFLISLIGLAQPFHWNEITMTTPDTRAFEPYDFDGDGDLDIVSMNYYSLPNNIFWMENDGEGNIIAKHPILESYVGITYPSDIIVNDMDNDALFDILLLYGSQKKISYLKQDASGNFTVSPVIYTDSVDIEQMVLQDMDADGDDDIVFVDEVKVAWIENLGSGNFSAPIIVLSGEDLSCILAIDMDSDNDIDLVCGGNNNSSVDLLWIENNGSNIFSTPDTIKLGTNRIEDIAIDDLDADGDLDIATASSYTAEVRYFENSGNMTFTESLVSNDMSYKILIKDIDNDGNMDILAAILPEGISWYENSGTSSFTTHYEAFPEVGGNPDLHFEDFNGDTIPDIIYSGSASPGLIKWKENLSGGTFSDMHKITSLSYIVNESVPADIDNDGDLDIVSTSSKYIFWHENLGMGKFSTEKNLYYAGTNPYILIKSLNVIDIDSDGDLDILASQNSYDGTVLCTNDGNGNFSIQLSYVSGLYNSEFAYIDNDTLIDILYTSIVHDKVGWKKNLGNGLFSDSIIDNTLNGPDEILPVDVDNDGDVDVIVSVDYEDKIGWYENTGNGSFSIYKSIDPDFHVKSIHINDLNGDNKQDILAVSSYYSSDELVWYKNLGGGLFSTAIQIDSSSNDNFNQVYSDDLDGDGDIDIVTSAQLGGKYYLNTDTGSTFTEHEMITTFGNPDTQGRTLRTGDLDNDGDMDVLSCGRGDHNIFYYQNLFNNFNDFTVETCGNYTEPSGDSTYYVSTLIYDTIPNSNGGDSILIIDLTILGDGDTTFTTDVICLGDTVFFGGEPHYQAGTYSDTLVNNCGLDSIVFLDLTVNYVGSTLINQTICEGDSILFGNSYLSNSGAYFDTLSNLNGCDSTVVLSLTIPYIDANISLNTNTLSGVYQPEATYQWLNCDDNFNTIDGENNVTFNPVTNGNYALQITLDGCQETSQCIVIQGIGLEETGLDLIRLSPNPSKGEFTISGLEAYQFHTINVFSPENKILHSFEVKNLENYTIQLNKKGVYFIKMLGHSTIEIKKVVIK